MILPNFLICGAEKSGTTSLYKYLNSHPDILFSKPKETFFFNRHFSKGKKWFAEHFNDYSGEKLIGEGTATTMYSSKAPQRIQEVLGSPKLIFVLRNPIDRAYSQYYFYLKKGKIEPSQSFVESIKEDSWGILSKGIYIDHLIKFSNFDKKILLSKDLKRKPVSTIREVFSFLGVNNKFYPTVGEEYNKTTYPRSRATYHYIRSVWHAIRSVVEPTFPGAVDVVRKKVRNIMFGKKKPEMSREVKEYLQDFYADPNVRLEHYLDSDLSHWK